MPTETKHTREDICDLPREISVLNWMSSTDSRTRYIIRGSNLQAVADVNDTEDCLKTAHEITARYNAFPTLAAENAELRASHAALVAIMEKIETQTCHCAMYGEARDSKMSFNDISRSASQALSAARKLGGKA